MTHSDESYNRVHSQEETLPIKDMQDNASWNSDIDPSDTTSSGDAADPSAEACEVQGDEVEDDKALLSENDEALRDVLLSSEDPENVDGDPAQECGEIPTVDFSTSQPPSDVIMVKVMDERLLINELCYPRDKIDPTTVKAYVEALRVGADFPPLIATLIDGKFVIVDGGHRLTATRKYVMEDHRKFFNDTHKERVEMMEKRGASEDDPNLPPMPATPPEEVACRIITIPEDQPAILVAYGYNRRHGLRPSVQDQKKTCRAVYKPGMPLTTIAVHLGISPKTVRSYVADMVAAYEDERRSMILRLAVDGYSNDEIASELASRYPLAQGTSSSSVSRSIIDARESLEKSRLGQPVKSKKASNKSGKSDAKSSKGVPPYPPKSSTGGTGASETSKSNTSGDGKTIWGAPSAAGTDTQAPPSGSSPAQTKTYTGSGSDASKSHADSGVWGGFVSPTITEGQPAITGNESDDSTLLDLSGTPESPQSSRDDTYYMGQLGLRITPYTTWTTSEKSIVANLMFFFTNQGDLVLDYASVHYNVLATVCSAMNRRIHDFRKDGWPRGKNPALIFVTPVPVENSPALDPGFTLNVLRHILRQAYENAKPGCRLALLCEDWLGETGEALLVFDYAAILSESGWTMTRAIQAPRLTPMFDEIISDAKEKRKLLDSARYLLITEKKEVLPDLVGGNDSDAEGVAGTFAENTPAADDDVSPETPGERGETEASETDSPAQTQEDDSAADAPEPSTENIPVEAPDEDSPVMTPDAERDSLSQAE